MKSFPIWPILTAILAIVILSFSQGMPKTPKKYVVASVGGGFVGLTIVLAHFNRRKPKP